jgi:hypothetical protein
MNPMLDKLELPQVQEISIIERRTLAEHKPPDMDGSLLQNMGRRPTRLALWGIATGPDALDFVQKLEGKFRDKKPVPFTTDIVADSKIEQVLISDLRVQDLAGKPQRYAYILTLREYIEPTEPKDTSALNTNILDDATKLMDDMIPGLTIGLDFATGLERFVTPFKDLLTRLQAANKATPSP